MTTLSAGKRSVPSSLLVSDARECSPLDVVAEALAVAASRAAALGVTLELKTSKRGGGVGEARSGGVGDEEISLSRSPLPVEGGADGRASFAALSSSSSSPPSLRLLPRPPRPLLAGIPASTLARATGDAVDSALQRCGRGGKVSVSVSSSSSSSSSSLLSSSSSSASSSFGASASLFGSGVLIDVIDSGGDWGMREELMSRLGGGGGGSGGGGRSRSSESGGATETAPAATVTAEPPSPPPRPPPSQSFSAAAAMERLAAGLPAGSGAAALAAASRAVAGAGGRVSVTPSGEGGTRVRIWLPSPSNSTSPQANPSLVREGERAAAAAWIDPEERL